MINHVVAMKFKPGVSEEEIRDLEKSLDQLPNKIMEIKMYEYGRDVVRSARSYDFGLVALFANPAALERYQNHPEHVPVVEKVKAMCETVVTVDFYGSDAGSTEAGPPPWERDPFEKLKL
jgi:Stress responsive A/B Barrel Domain